MSELLAEQLTNDVTGFESQVIDLRGRKETLLQQINEVDSKISNIEPLYSYAKGLLKLTQTTAENKRMQTAAATKAAADKRRAQKQEKTTNPN